MSSSSHTTLPATPPLDAANAGAVLAVRWLFPSGDGGVSLLAEPRVVLGRGEDCGTVLGGSEISRRHAELFRDGPIVVLRDLDSRNGSFVNGERTAEAPLRAGDVVRVGEWVGIALELVPADGVPDGPGTIAPGLMGGATLRAAVEPAFRAAQSDLPIIIEGETGTGKEVMARAVHSASGRGGPFVAVNCAALPDSLAEAELFGYRRGAFTGAERASAGHFRAAHGGVLLLDEITELPTALQAKVLRVLEQREVTPLGESKAVPVDVRIIVAAQEPLDRAVFERRFRADLYARLEGLTIRLPPLRERIDDVPYLFERLLSATSGGQPPAVDPRMVERLCLYDWPFNVRELVTLVRRVLVLHGQEPTLQVGHLPPRYRASGPNGDAGATPADVLDPAQREQVDFERLIAALRLHRGNISRAAVTVGFSRQRCYRLMQDRPELDLDGLRAQDGKGSRAAT